MHARWRPPASSTIAGSSRLPILVLNATYPLVADQLVSFCAGKRAVLVLEEGHPEFIEFELAAVLGRAGGACVVRGKAAMGTTGEYSGEVIMGGLVRFVSEFCPSLSTAGAAAWRTEVDAVRARASALLASPVPVRPPGFCIGCPERPVFSALKLVERELGPRHVAADIGCHSFAMFEPFSTGNSILGYGMGLASAAGVGPISEQRPLATVGDGGFWHNGFLSGVTSALKNGSDSVLLIFKNGYTSATGTQELAVDSGGCATRRCRRREHDRNGYDDRERAARCRREVAAHRAQLRRGDDEVDARGCVHDGGARPQGRRRGR